MKMKYIRYGLMVILIMSAIVLLVSCGSSGGGDDSESPATPPAEGDEEAGGVLDTIVLQATERGIPADGESYTTITGLLQSQGLTYTESEEVLFTTTLGTVGWSEDTADAMDYSGWAWDGVAEVVLKAGITPGTAQVTASVGAISSTIDIDISGSGVPAIISLSTSQTTVQSDNSDSATITATVLDSDRAIVQGWTVSFSANGGQISASSVDTDGNGEAQTLFSAGTASGGTSQIVTITAVVGGLAPVQIPIQVAGTTVVLSTDNTNITIGDPPVDLTVYVQDFGSGGLPDVPVTLSVSPAGLVTLSQTSGNTDINGELVVQVTGIATGSVTVTATALAITDTLTYSVGAAGTVFGISSPTDPWNLDTNTDLTVTVAAPGVTNVIFATTLGAWDGGVDLVVTKLVVAGSASAVLNSPTAGVASVQVFDAADPSTMDSLTVAISAPPIEASQISLQPSTSVVAPSYGDVTNTVTLEATVKNVADQVVGNAPVAFSIVNPTGGGETISPVIAFTETNGVATSTFTSGSLSSGAEGVTVTAVVVGMPLVTDSTAIVIGGTAGSVIIGQSTKFTSIAGDTAYSMPMSVLVADSNGNPVPGAVVSLSAWPIYYYTGFN